MRELKFRVWANNIMHNDGEDEKDGNIGLVVYSNHIVNNKDIVVMQFTGLKDKNGKEIYEGDIIFNKGILVGEVKFGIYKYEDESNHDRQKQHMGWYVHVLGDGKYTFEHMESLERQFYNLQDNLSIIKREDQNWVEVKGNKFVNVLEGETK